MALWALERTVECMDGVVTPETVTTTRSPAVLKKDKQFQEEKICSRTKGGNKIFFLLPKKGQKEDRV